MKVRNFIKMVIIVLMLGSCSTTYKFPVSLIAPAADGTAKIKMDKNKNYVIDLKVKNLANADRLNPPRQHYVVWITSDNKKTSNIGMLVSDKKNNASLRGVTSAKPAVIFITAEDDNNVEWPGNQELFRIQNLELN